MSDNTDKLISRAANSALHAWSHRSPVCNEFPQVIYICPTNVCNHHCCYCARHAMRKGVDAEGKKQRGFMPWGTFEKVIESLPHEGRRVYLQKFGESLLHKDFGKMARYLKQKRPEYELALHTNASRLEGDVAVDVLETVDHLAFSIYGIDRESYKTIHKRDHFDLVIANMNKFHQLCEKSSRRPEVFIYFLRTEFNKDFSDSDVYSWFNERFPLFNVGIYDVYNYQNFIPGIEMYVAEHLPLEKFPHCIIPYTIMTVLWDGKVGYCLAEPEEKYTMGDVKDNTLLEIWNSERYKNFRALMAEKKFDELEDLGIRCKVCNWLFSLPTNSLENICISARKHFKEAQSAELRVTSYQNFKDGFKEYLQGNINSALNKFYFSKIASADPDVQKISQEWVDNCIHVLAMRKDIDSWDTAFKNMGKDLTKFMVTRYKNSKTVNTELHDNRFEAKSDVFIKKHQF